MRSFVTATLTITVFVVLIGMSHGDVLAEVNRWNGFASTAFTQGFVRTDCLGQTPCHDDAFNLSGGSSADCPEELVGPGPHWDCAPRVEAVVGVYYNLSGFAGHFPGGQGDTLVGTGIHLSGQRVDADLFTVNGQVYTTGLWPGMVQVAVFQYSSDPTAFDGLEVDSVEELVDLGIIASDDILAVETGDDLGEVHMQVQVTGLSDDEIVVFGAGDGRIPTPVPATNVAGAALLLLVMLGLGTWALRRRRTRTD